MDGVELVFDIVRLSKVFYILTDGLVEYVWTKDENCMLMSKHSQG